jgi:hypothetical protein
LLSDKSSLRELKKVAAILTFSRLAALSLLRSLELNDETYPNPMTEKKRRTGMRLLLMQM